MKMIKLENGNIVWVVTMDTDTTSDQFIGVYRTLNLAIADVKFWFANLNEVSLKHDFKEDQKHWEMTSASQCTQTWTCKNSKQIRTISFSEYGL